MAGNNIFCWNFLIGILLLNLMMQAEQACFDNFVVTSPTPMSLQATWTFQNQPNCPTPLVDDIIISIFLEYKDQCEDIKHEAITSNATAKDESAFFGGLHAFSTYLVAVLPEPKDAIATLIFSTWNTAEGDIRGSPTNITATSFSSSLKFAWDNVTCGQRGAHINMYRVRLVETDDEEEEHEETTSDRYYEFEGLSPDTEYAFQVQALADGADGGVKSGQYSEPVRIRTADTIISTTTEESETNESDLIPVIIAVPASIVLLLLIIAVGALVYCKVKKKSPSNSDSFSLPIGLELLPEEEYDVLQNVNRGTYEIAWKNLIVSKTLLGQGKFGSVHEGRVKISNSWIRVAVKSIRSETHDEDSHDFDKELKMMKKIGRHVNIVSLVGACKHKGTLFVALEYVRHGNLKQFLKDSCKEAETGAAYSNTHDQMVAGYTSNLSSSQLVELALGVAKGMRYLASKEIIHRDLAARNVLVAGDDPSYVAKISDFGLSRGDRIYEQPIDSMSKLPIKWTAPEALTECPPKFTTKSDVWSFGVLLWEIVTFGGKPYSKPPIRNDELANYLEAGHRMDKPHNCDKKLYDLMMACWRQSPRSRPTFDVLVEELEILAQDGSRPYVITKIGGENISFVPINSNEYEMHS